MWTEAVAVGSNLIVYEYLTGENYNKTGNELLV